MKIKSVKIHDDTKTIHTNFMSCDKNILYGVIPRKILSDSVLLNTFCGYGIRNRFPNRVSLLNAAIE